MHERLTKRLKSLTMDQITELLDGLRDRAALRARLRPAALKQARPICEAVLVWNEVFADDQKMVLFRLRNDVRYTDLLDLEMIEENGEADAALLTAIQEEIATRNVSELESMLQKLNQRSPLLQ